MERTGARAHFCGSRGCMLSPLALNQCMTSAVDALKGRPLSFTMRLSGSSSLLKPGGGLPASH